MQCLGVGRCSPSLSQSGGETTHLQSQVAAGGVAAAGVFAVGVAAAAHTPAAAAAPTPAAVELRIKTVVVSCSILSLLHVYDVSL